MPDSTSKIKKALAEVLTKSEENGDLSLPQLSSMTLPSQWLKR